MFLKKINLGNYCNHKLFYENIPEDGKPFGLDNICVLKQNYIDQAKSLNRNVLYDCCLGELDNVICNLQTVLIKSKVKKWHFLGFAYWGDVNELFRVLYADGTEDIIEVAFDDWACPHILDLYEKSDNCDNMVEDVFTVVSTGKMIHPIYFHDSIVKSHNDKIVKGIIFPNNILVHIFAITIEY